MARNVTLEELIEQVRYEVGQTVQPGAGQGNADAIAHLLRRNQNRLHEDFNWPHLRVVRDETLAASSYSYGFPVDLDQGRIERVWAYDGATWHPVPYGISPEHYNTLDPDTDTRDPVARWQVRENDSYEVWPTPATDGLLLRFQGIAKLPPLKAAADRCALDGDMLVLYAAAEMLARQKSADAQAKLQAADRLYVRLRANSQKTDTFVMGGGLSTGDDRLRRQADRYAAGPRQ